MAVALGAIALLMWVHAPAAGATTLPPGFGETTIATGFDAPTAVDWAPDGRMFVAEKAGRVRVVNPDGTLQPVPLLDIRDQVNSFSDRGLLGLAVDTDFETNGYLYLLYSYELRPGIPDSSASMVARLTRVTVNPDNTLVNPASPETVILGSDVSGPCPEPDNTRDCIPADYRSHGIGTVRSDPTDGTLWVGVGDAHGHGVNETSYRPYDPESFAGKILHIDRQGRGLPGHPFCPADTNLDHTCTKVYARGFRNPYRFTLREGRGPVVGDVGANDYEEIDLIRPGENYGWPCYEGPIRTPLYDEEPRCLEEYAREGTPGAATPPSWSYPQGDGAAVIAGPTYSGTKYPEHFRGDVFVGDYAQGWVTRLEVNDQDEVTDVHPFATSWPLGVSLEQTPTGEVAYVDIGFGATEPAVRRFDFTGGNVAPTAQASATPTSGDPPLAVQFTGSGSTDPDGDTLSYNWDFGDGSAHSTLADPTHTYSEVGEYTARLTVGDGMGHTDTDTVTVSVGGNAAPTATIDAPADESTYRGGQPVALQGSATDPEDGALTGGSLAWQVLLHHGSHVHDYASLTGTDTAFTPATDHGADSFYEIRLRATDSGGRTHTHAIEVRPETSELTLASWPPGVSLTFDDRAQTAPYTIDAGVGHRAAVSAPATVVRSGQTYDFYRWSDGGARQHEITVPADDTTLIAQYVRGATPVTASPDGVEVVRGTKVGGSKRSLVANDGDYYRVKSERSGGKRLSVFAGVFEGVPKDVENLALSYRGKNSRSCRQAVRIWDFARKRWVTLDTRAVGAREVKVSATPPGAAADYVRGSSEAGNVRLSIRCTAGERFRQNGDLLKIEYRAP